MITRQLLERVPGAAPRVSALPGGRHNRLFRIDTDAGCFVLRQRAADYDPPGVDRARESAIQRAAATAGLAPKVIACEPSGGWLLMDYVAGESWTAAAFDERDTLVRVGERLARLHALPPAPCRAFDPLGIAQAQLARIAAARPDEVSELASLVTELRELAMRLEELGSPLVMNHGDLDASNLLGDAPLLIDWEYAQVADPLYDIACILTYYPAALRHLDDLLGATGLGDPLSARRLPLQLREFGLLNRLWSAAEALSG